ncbi:MAG: J domain-containing protein [Candidatus Omnitrophica bacterium]|nr:J domain-containing protein [Candidatus Omnitrophota bacterium]
MSPIKDYYKILKVSQSSGQFQIKRAYRRLALEWYPQNVVPERQEEAENNFKEIVEAYYVLGNKESRKTYDHQRATESSVIKPSDTWGFVESNVRLFDPDTFTYYLNEQKFHCDALELDWREFFGGLIARALALMVFFLLLLCGHGLLPQWSVITVGNGVEVPWPALIAMIYIVAEPFRDFIWEYIGEEEMYDVYALVLAWLVMAMSVVIMVATITTPAPTAPAVTEEKEITKPISALPVNLEIFNVKPPPDPDDKHKVKKSGGEI